MADQDPAPPLSHAPLPDVSALVAGDTAAPPPPGTTPPGDVSDFELDRTRKQLAYRLLWILIGIVGVILLMSVIYSLRCWTDAQTCSTAATALGILTGAASPIFTAMIGLVGSVVGFYFGSKST